MPSVTFYYPHPESPLDVVVDDTTNSIIDDLWQQARTKAPSLADHIGGAWCKFYTPSDLSLNPSATLLPRSGDWLRRHRDDGPRFLSFDVVSNAFPTVTPDVVLVLVVTQGLLDGLDDLGDLASLALKQRGKGIKSFLNSFPSPSTGVSSYIGVERIVNHNRDNFHAGRPAGNFGPPVSLFNPALGLFDHRLRHLDHESSIVDLPPSLIQLAHMFMAVAADSYPDEHTWASSIKDILSQIFPATLNWEASQTWFGIKPGAIKFGDTPFFVVVKNEAGLEGDSSLEAALSYAHIATSPVDTDSRKPSNYPAMHSNYPVVLYGIMGNLLEIGAATYTDGPYYSLLFSERLHLGFHAAKNILRLARAFAATQRVIADLTEFYAVASPAPGSIAHLFPSPLPLPTYTGSVPSLTFTRRLSPSGEAVVLAKDETTRQSGIYLATMARPRSADEDEDEDTVTSLSGDALADTSEVVVKFTEQYNPEAHHLLATKGLAPVLHACVPVCGGLFMIVMDCVHGEMAWQAGNRRELLPYDIYKDIKDAVALLHSNNLVFGDLRTSKIMVAPGGSGSDTRRRGMLIDFDCVGAHGIGRYPASLDNALCDWELSGVQRCGIMDKAHDLVMLKQFKDKCCSV